LVKKLISSELKIFSVEHRTQPPKTVENSCLNIEMQFISQNSAINFFFVADYGEGHQISRKMIFPGVSNRIYAFWRTIWVGRTDFFFNWPIYIYHTIQICLISRNASFIFFIDGRTTSDWFDAIQELNLTNNDFFFRELFEKEGKLRWICAERFFPNWIDLTITLVSIDIA
jgi:hypothetical protein